MSRIVKLEVDGKSIDLDLDDPVYRGMAVAKDDPGIVILDRHTDYGLPKIPDIEAVCPAPSDDAEKEIAMFSKLMDADYPFAERQAIGDDSSRVSLNNTDDYGLKPISSPVHTQPPPSKDPATGIKEFSSYFRKGVKK